MLGRMQSSYTNSTKVEMLPSGLEDPAEKAKPNMKKQSSGFQSPRYARVIPTPPPT